MLFMGMFRGLYQLTDHYPENSMSTTNGSAQDDVYGAIETLEKALAAKAVSDHQNFDRINAFRKRVVDIKNRWVGGRAAHRDPASRAERAPAMQAAPEDPRPYYAEAGATGNISRTDEAP